MTITTEQLAARRLGIGSSDTPALLRLSRWKSRHQLWLEKTGRYTFKGNEKTHRGNLLEPVIVDLAVEEHLGPEWVVERHCDTMRDGILIAHLDARAAHTDGRTCGIEAKATGVREGWHGDDECETVPDIVMAQVQHQMLVCRLDFAIVGVMFLDRDFDPDSAEFESRIVTPNPDFQGLIREEAERFWRDYVETDTPPPIEDVAASDLPILAELDRKASVQATLPAGVAAEYERLRIIAKDAEDRLKTFKAQLIAQLGDCEYGIDPESGGKINYALVQTRRLSTTAVKERYPEVAEACMIDASHRRLTVRLPKAKA